MHHSEYLIDVLIFLAAAVIVVPIFKRYRSSPILGYLAVGIAIGPHGLSLIRDTQAAQTLGELGVLFLLFLIGLELSVSRLRKLRSRVFGLGTLQVVVTGLLISTVVWYLGFSIEATVVIGGGLALSSTAFVLHLLLERRERTTRFGSTTFSILLFQDLAVVPLLILVSLLGTQGSSFIEIIGLATLKGIAALIFVFAFGRYLMRPLYKMVASSHSPEIFVSTTLLMILGMGWLMSIAGLSMELGALMAGLLLAETEYRHQIEADIRPFRGILLGLFFISIGMSIDLAFIVDNAGVISAIVASLMLGKVIVTAGICRAFGIPASTSLRTGFTLSQSGEFGFILFGAALALNLIPSDTVQILIAVITITMIATPLMYFAGKEFSGIIKRRARVKGSTAVPMGQEATDHVLIAGFGRVGQTVAKVLSDGNIPYVALDMDHARVENCRERGMDVFYGNANHLFVLQAAGAERARVAVITLDQTESASQAVLALRKNYPELPIYVRARDRRHMIRLLQEGATEVVAEAAESSLQLGGFVLRCLDVDDDEITSIIATYRDDDYALLEEII